jgi:hypothetical protein
LKCGVLAAVVVLAHHLTVVEFNQAQAPLHTLVVVFQ